MEESDIILNILKKGEKKGLELLFRKFYEPLVLYAYKFLREQSEAEDVVQEVFIKFWKRNKFADIEAYLRSYLYQSVRNSCLNRLEVRKGILAKNLKWRDEVATEEFPDETQWIAQLDLIYQEIEKLPLKTRLVFKAIVLENKTYKEVAEEQKISVNTVKTLFSRSLSTLRTHLNALSFIFFFFLRNKK